MGCIGSKKSAVRQDSRLITAQASTLPPFAATLNVDLGHLVGDQPLVSPGWKGTMATLASASNSAARLQTKAPVADILEGKKNIDQIKEESFHDDSFLRQEAPARQNRRTSLDVKVEQAQALADLMKLPSVDKEPELPVIKDISNTKSTFNSDKFRKVNQGGLLPLSSLPMTVQEQLDDIQPFGVVVEKRRMKPSSTLSLLGKQDHAITTGPGRSVIVRPLEEMKDNRLPRTEDSQKNMEQYLDGHLSVKE